MTVRLVTIALVAIAATVALAGCDTGREQTRADKVGGPNGPTVLRLGSNDAADQPDTPLVEYFAAQVEKLSGGKLRVRIILEAAGHTRPDTEERIARMVRGGDLDLGWIGARAWDELGLASFQALQAPFLITDYAVLDRVARSPLATEMLAGLKRENVVGLALVPGLLRHPVGLRRPFTALSDFEGARVRDPPSAATDALLRALGATPSHVANAAYAGAVGGGRLDAVEASFANAPVGGIVAANVTFFGKALTLFAGQRAFAALSPEQQAVLRRAAQRTVVHATAFPVSAALAFEGVLARRFCHTPGHMAFASERELAALARAARPVYRALERDAQTKRLIGEIRALKASLPPAPRIVVPATCLSARGAPPVAGEERSPGSVNGTYRWLLTAAGARAFGPPANDPGNAYPLVVTMVLRDGRWKMPRASPPDSGTYRVFADRIVFGAPSFGYDLAFRLVREHDGSLRLRPVLPMDRGDQWVWSGRPWRRIGPPAGAIP